MARDKDRRAKTYVREGMEAAEQGLGVDACPYHSRVEAREGWLAGHQRGPASRLDTIDTPARRFDTMDTPAGPHATETFQ